MNGSDSSAVTVHSNQWMLFGIDMRHLGQQWLAAWQELLLSEASPIRRRLDDPVLLLAENESRLFQGGAVMESEASVPTHSVARLLPDELVLVRKLRLPLAAEAELMAVIAMEVEAGSPFTRDDTVYGWSEVSRDDQSMEIVLAIASRASVTQWLREAPLEQDARDPEVWAEAHGQHVTIRGFGESRRERSYRRRLLRSVMLVGGLLLLLLFSASLFAVQQRSALDSVETLQAAVQHSAQGVSTMRETLVAANETIHAASEVMKNYPNPHLEIARLTDLLGDDVFIAHFSMRGREMRIRGQAADAATVMQTLAETPDFAEVTAPQAITAVGNTGIEQFHLDIEVAATAGADTP